VTKSTTKPTTAQSLGALIKSARDIMRKDKGLNGDLDRLPMLTWIMFLKFLDDLEIQRQGEAKLAATKFKPAIEPPCRWRDWAAQPDGITGDELMAFINQDETILRKGKKGPGLVRHLRTLTSSNGDNRRDVIATVFHGVGCHTPRHPRQSLQRRILSHASPLRENIMPAREAKAALPFGDLPRQFGLDRILVGRGLGTMGHGEAVPPPKSMEVSERV
jgi:type I restriction enzyme M protein